jgi:DNA invertase Pin-like site-specific DNA recombinase
MRTFDDKIGGSRAERPGLAKVMENVREGILLSFGSWTGLVAA